MIYFANFNVTDDRLCRDHWTECQFLALFYLFSGQSCRDHGSQIFDSVGSRRHVYILCCDDDLFSFWSKTAIINRSVTKKRKKHVRGVVKCITSWQQLKEFHLYLVGLVERRQIIIAAIKGYLKQEKNIFLGRFFWLDYTHQTYSIMN